MDQDDNRSISLGEFAAFLLPATFAASSTEHRRSSAGAMQGGDDGSTCSTSLGANTHKLPADGNGNAAAPLMLKQRVSEQIPVAGSQQIEPWSTGGPAEQARAAHDTLQLSSSTERPPPLPVARAAHDTLQLSSSTERPPPLPVARAAHDTLQLSSSTERPPPLPIGPPPELPLVAKTLSASASSKITQFSRSQSMDAAVPARTKKKQVRSNHEPNR